MDAREKGGRRGHFREWLLKMREWQADALGEAPVAGARQVTGKRHRRGVIVATLAAILMTYVGAFDTAELPFMPRLAYWLIIMESGALIGVGASTGIRSWGRLADRPLLEGLAISVLIALPLTLVATGTTALFFGPRAFGVEGTLAMFVAVFVVTGAITAINYLTWQGERFTMPIPPAHPAEPEAQALPSTDDLAPDASLPRPQLIDRLPPHLRSAKIMALEAEDHYVRVHTERGFDLLLLRLTDAMAELDGLPGARTHRSWWVARDAVTSASKGDGRGELVLANGVAAPVSRSALSALQREGWFAG